MRTMWVHAYQSHVWNCMACRRIRLLGAGAVPGDLVLLDGDVAASSPPEGGKDDVPGAESCPSGSGVDAAPSTIEPSGVGGESARGDVVVSCPAEMETAAAVAVAADEPSKPAPDSPRSKGPVSVLTREVMERFASEGVTVRDLLKRVVLPLAGTSVQYPHHGVSLATHGPPPCGFARGVCV